MVCSCGRKVVICQATEGSHRQFQQNDVKYKLIYSLTDSGCVRAMVNEMATHAPSFTIGWNNFAFDNVKMALAVAHDEYFSSMFSPCGSRESVKV